MVPSLQSNVRRSAVAVADDERTTVCTLPKLLPQEWLCGIFLVSMWIRLVSNTGFFGKDTISFLFFIALNIAAIAFCSFRETEFRWRIRLLFYPVIMNLVYFVLTTAVPAVHPKLEDEMLQAADRWLVGTDLSLLLQAWVQPILTEFLSFCYLWYLFYLFASETKYFMGSLETLKKFYAGLFSIYAIGYLGYSTMPALGPHMALADQFWVPLEGCWFTQATSRMVLAASNRVDLFPSLHVANSLYILLFDRRHDPRRFCFSVVPCLGLFLSTIYLRYHYLIDVVCGVALALVALRLSGCHVRKHA